MITSHTLNPAILKVVRKKVQDKAVDSEATWNITIYIEKIIIDMLPKEEKYEVLKERMIERHVIMLSLIFEGREEALFLV